MTKVLAITSGGGHWEQMMLIKEGFADLDIVYANTIAGLAEKSGVSPSYVVPDCNRSHPMSVLRCLRAVWSVIRQEKPDVIVSTGAAPGIVALGIGKLTGKRTIWIDSVANSERLSLSGKMAGRFVDLWLTQWEHLAGPKGPHYWGNVL